MYIHRQFNHPPNIIKNIPSPISLRLTDTSSGTAAFEDARQLYDNALRESGFSEQVEFLESRKINSKNVRRKNRSRNITWFNPPFSQNVATNIGRMFRSLVSKHFPKNSRLHQIFNENTPKVSYSCMPNMAAVISQHNKATINNVSKPPTSPGCHATDPKRCNCRTKGNCPMDGNCHVQSVVHRATVETADCRRDYTGLTALTFKERFNGHQYSMRHRNHRNSTALSKYVWSLKDKNTDFNIRWSVRKRATAYQNTTRMSNLCLAEKLEVIRAGKKRSLNKRTELVSNMRTASTSVISRRLCHELVPLHFSDFPTFCFCRFFDPFELFEILPAFSDLAVVFRIFRLSSSFPLYNYALFIVF